MPCRRHRAMRCWPGRYSLLCYTPQPSSGGAMPCHRRRAMRCCLGHHSAVLWRASYGNGPTRWVRCTRWPYTMGPLYTVALYDGSVVHGGPLYDGSVVHGGPLYDGSVVHGGPNYTMGPLYTRWPYTMGPLYTVAPSVRARG